MEIRVGLGSCGMAAGGNRVYETIQKLSEDNSSVKVSLCGCIGLCFLEPIVDIIEENRTITYGHVDSLKMKQIYEDHVLKGQIVDKYLVYTNTNKDQFESAQKKITLENCGVINPENIKSYIAKGGYKALEKAIHLIPSQIIDQLKISNLRGRGGAGFPTWYKWDITSKQSGEKYIVCNADEGDPGAFMDRSLLEGDPHKVIEGMIIAAYAIQASKGIIYCRAEYPLAIERLTIAIHEARKRAFLGENILNTTFSFDIEIKMGAGAYVCGEETALIESLEGKRGMPRLKPPYPAAVGYNNQPTCINNVETFANISWIISNGGEEFANIGTSKSTGTKVFALSGKVKKSGLVEVPMGITLKDIIYTVGGGIKDNKKFKAVQLGGPSGGCIPYQLLNTKVSYEDIVKTGAIMGSGGMVVMDESTCMVDIARFFLKFSEDESCGKCVHCRIGTKRMLDILNKICDGSGTLKDLQELEDLSYAVIDGSLCGLGQTAPNPVLTGLKYFKDEYLEHINEKKCVAKVCKPLLTWEIVAKNCVGCTACAVVCPSECIDGAKKEIHFIQQDLCIKCGNCLAACNYDAINVY